MCGIGGYFSMHAAPGDERLRRMTAALRHRGPDGEGAWRADDGRAGLVHTRLAIIDLNERAAQPMHSTDGRYVLVFNGEIYNYRELRRDLQARGHAFSTDSDTEVLLVLLAADGVAGLRRLRGMYALALWDRVEARGLLARDGFGIKPLYVARVDGGVVFASELRTVLASGIVPFRLDPDALEALFATGSVPEPMSLVEGVEVLPPGHALTWSAGQSRVEPFWTVEFPEPRIHEARAAAEVVREALHDSIAAHFVSDVPVGLFLSGGIDSTALLSLAARAGHASGMDTFSVSVDAAHFDEAGVAAQSARHFGSRHHVLRLDAQAAAESLDAFVAAMDVPSVDGFNTWTVSRLARSHGMKVVLSGLGGDEVFGGYPSFARVPRLARMARLARTVPPVADLAGKLIERHARSSPARRVGGLLRSRGTYRDAYRAYRGIFPPADARRLAAHFAGEPRGMPRTEPALPAGWPRDDADRVSHLELTGYMRNQLLRDSDVMSMAHGLELRLPLVDQRLFDTVAPIAPRLRVQAGKRLLTAAVDDLPDAVRLAPKRGFSFPFQAWFGDRLDARMATPGLALPVRATEWYQRWTLFVFLRWLDARQRDAAA